MAARERWLSGVGAELDLRGAAFFRSSGVPALKRPDPEPELEPEKEDVNTPNIAVVFTRVITVHYCTTRFRDA